MSITQSFAQDLEFRRIDQLMRQNLTSPLNISVAVLFAVIAGWDNVPPYLLIAWSAAWMISALVRALVNRKWFALKSQGYAFGSSDLKLWNWYIVGGCFYSGVCAGLMGAGSKIFLDANEQLYIGLLLIGVVSSSVAAYALSYASLVGVLAPTLAIWLFALATQGGSTQLFILLTIYAGVNLRLAKNWNTFALNSLRTNADLQQNQDRLRLALDSSGAACWSWHPASNSFSGDKNIAAVLDHSSVEFENLEDYFKCVHPLDLIAVRNAFAKALETGSLDIEHRLPGNSEHPRFVSLRGQVQGQSTISQTISGIAWDITNKRNEERTRFERDLLERANRTKLMFLANVSHEMRTPLTAINGFTENVLSDSSFPSRLRERLNIVLRNGRYLTSVVHDLLDLSKAEADSIFIENGKVNLPEEINDSIHVVRANLERKHLSIDVVYDSPVPEMVVTDATRLRQILINLLSNSIKYTDHGEITIRVSFEGREASGQLKIIVADTGIGISEQDIHNLFQPFARGEALRVRQQQGSGLGLVLSRSLATKMGGDLRLLYTVVKTDTSEGGTAFELNIEVGACHGVRRLQRHPVITASSARQPELFENTFDKRKILLVEDDEDIRWLLKEYLEKRGATVTSCENGAEGVRAAFESHFDAVLMDIKMPVLDGLQATQRLRQKGFRPPIIALTAHANSSDMNMCYEAGCDHYLSKPVDFNHLNEVLCRCIDGSSIAIN